MYSVDWKAIRPWNGSQYGGFEELCVQLARVETLHEVKRPGAPDAGVECYCVLPDGNEWGWQAKYFTSPLTNTQWQQIDGSIQTALDKHQRLVRYYVCVPRDRSEARIPNQTSEMDRWNDHVAKWQDWARDRGMNVEFVWWGSSELIDRLSLEEHTGRRFFWFSQHEFSQDWFCRRLNEAVKAAGPRYTPEVHIDLPIAQDMERFSRSHFLFDEVKSLAIGIRKAHDGLVSTWRPLEEVAGGTGLDDLSKAAGVVLENLALLEPSPIASLPFAGIAGAAEEADRLVNHVSGQIRELQRQHETQSRESRSSRTYYQEPFGDLLYHLHYLRSGLQEVVEACSRADYLANNQLLLLKGDGGTGKTHLLCDFSEKRVQAQLPTILLMGQQFLSEDDPWVQLLQRLDLPSTSSEEFVGALEASAQASCCRALVIVDALNEGNGRRIWPTHLSSFLVRLQKSPWIGVVLSVRSSYAEYVIPEDERQRAASVTHYGFDDHEYNAARTFFEHFGLEFPSAPILQPEFRNPLFLMTLCKGLRDSGERRIPRGFHGITAAFDLYLNSINARLARTDALDYDPRDNHVREALERIAERLTEGESRWLLRTEARTVVDALLPGRSYSASLYQALVGEGILTENIDLISGGLSEEVVLIGYERFADHIIADRLIRTHLDVNSPEAAFSNEGGLAFLTEDRNYVPHGLIEALCIQIPERIGRELVSLAPNVLNHPGIAHAFLQSITWRRCDAFFEDTHAVLGDFIQQDDIWEEFLVIVMSVSTVPGHPFNADSLDRRLRQDSMPDRDSWWSTYLHRAWETQGPVDRLLDWASGLSSDDDVEDDVIDLAATALAWMFATPNRYLRDRATKALISLLTGRLKPAGRLVDRFADVDDPYVEERLYAVAYGVAMRSHDVITVGNLALMVYERVFASGSPPPHLLLRDYARGVVERAIYLGTHIPFNVSLIRPPYKSTWPHIPGEEDIEALTSNWQQGAWAGGDLEWSRNRIRHSVMGDFLNDFARYVVGTESEPCWLSLRLDEDLWQSPEDRINALIGDLSEAERLAYERFRMVENEPSPLLALIRRVRSGEEHHLSRALEQHERRKDTSRRILMSRLTEDHKLELESIFQAKTEGPPRFDVRAIQRYVLKRVFDLGWTIERFGWFDRFSIGDHGRSANKPERMGKKYQWLAYYEILAYLSDHYKYRESSFGDKGDRQYDGPWQLHVRDIDPSCTLRSTPGGTSWGPHSAAWWGDAEYSAWASDLSHQDWLALETDIPGVEDLLQVVCPDDGSHWFNVCGRFVWTQSHPTDVGPFEIERRRLELQWDAYIVRTDDVDAFMDWVGGDGYSPRSLPQPPNTYLHYMFFGEYGWSPAFNHRFSDYDSEGGWVSPEGRGCPVDARTTTVSYTSESGGFDCSVDEHYTLHLPHPQLLDDLGLEWSGRVADYIDESRKLVAFDPTAHEDGPTALLLRKESLEQHLELKGQALCWVMYGEKMIIGGKAQSEFQGHLKISGVYRYTDRGPDGYLAFSLDPPEGIDR